MFLMDFKRLAALFAALWWLAITWLSTRGGVPLPGFSLLQTDKLAHAAAYALLVFLCLSSLKSVSNRHYFLFFLLAFCYGAIMEWVQYRFFPNRFYELDDMLANGIGAAASILVFHFWKNRKSKLEL